MRVAEFLAADAERIRGNFEEAEAQLKKFLEGDRENAAALYSLAQVYAKTERYDDAVKTVKKALDQEPTNEWYARLLGFVYETQERDDLAAEVYGDLTKNYPDREYFAQRRAYFLVRAGEPKQAIAVYDQLEKRFGTSEEYSRDKHRIYLNLGDYKRAERELQNLVDRFPERSDYLHYLANFYQQINQGNKAQQTYAKILEMDPNDARAQVAVAGRGKATGDAKLAALEAIFEKSDVPLDVKVKQLIPYVQRVAETNDLNLATQLYPAINTLESVHGASAPLHAIRGDLAYHTQQPEVAYDHYAAALDLDPSVYAVWENALLTLAETRNFTKLAEQSERALDYYPNQPMIYLLNARAYNATRDYAGAMNALMQSELMIDESSPLYYQMLLERTLMQVGSGDTKNARTTLENAAKLNPRDPRLELVRAEVLTAEGKTSEADRARERSGMSKEDLFMRGMN